MPVDWAAIASLGVGGTVLVGTWYQAKRGASAADKDNRFQVLNATVETLQRENQRYQDEIAAAEGRYRQQDEHIDRQDELVITLRRRHREAIEHLGDAQLEIADLHRRLAVAQRRAPNDP